MKDKIIDYARHHKEQVLKGILLVSLILIALVIILGKGQESGILLGAQAEEAFLAVEESEAEKEAQTESESEDTSILYVDISGAVHQPGVFPIASETRLFEAIEMAGGLKENADVSLINMAIKLRDEEKIYIPKIGEKVAPPVATTQPPYGNGSSTSFLIDINRADSQELQQLTGVGPATAEKIILYRREQGNFQAIEDIMNVSGIGEKTFAKFKDKIRI